MDWMKENGYGGVMVWSIDMDDFSGRCGSGKFPLLKSLNTEMEGYKVDLEYEGPYESYKPGGKYTTKDRKLNQHQLETVIHFLIKLFLTANEVTCAEQDGHISYHPDKLDCTHYYMCEGERKHHMPCPSNLVFNPNENVCDWPENVESCHHHTQVTL
jgi:chitinase